MLTASEILKATASGEISITPWNADNLNPNSYNLSIGNEVQLTKDTILDFKTSPALQTLVIPTNGLILQPGRLYLAKTLEFTETKGLVPVLYGRSSSARLGLFVHASAGLGDTGYKGHWTLSLIPTQPIRIYPNQSIAQLVFFKPQGIVVEYSGKYQNTLNTGNYIPDEK